MTEWQRRTRGQEQGHTRSLVTRQGTDSPVYQLDTLCNLLDRERALLSSKSFRTLELSYRLHLDLSQLTSKGFSCSVCVQSYHRKEYVYYWLVQ